MFGQDIRAKARRKPQDGQKKYYFTVNGVIVYEDDNREMYDIITKTLKYSEVEPTDEDMRKYNVVCEFLIQKKEDLDDYSYLINANIV